MQMDRNAKGKWLARVLKALEERVLIVEGKHDSNALKVMGVSTEIVSAVGRTERIVESSKKASEMAEKKIALLFDFDAEGERKTSFFEEVFFRHDVNVDVRLRKEVRRLFRVRTIEELAGAYERMQEEIGESTGSRK